VSNIEPQNQTNQTLPDQPYEQLTLLDLENMTFKAYVSLDALQAKLKEKKQMVDDGYRNNPAFQEKNQSATDAKKSLLQVKAEIDKVPGTKLLLDEISELKRQVKDKKDEVSTNATQYADTAATDLMERDGTLYRIVRTAKLVKASANTL
jgi:hypothetical protein